MAKIGQANPSFQEDKSTSENSVQKRRRQKRENALVFDGTYKASKLFFKNTKMDEYLLAKYAPDEDKYVSRDSSGRNTARVTGDGEITREIGSRFGATEATAVSRYDGSSGYLSHLELNNGRALQTYDFDKKGLKKAHVSKANFEATWEVNARGVLERTNYWSGRKRDGHFLSFYQEEMSKPIAGTDGVRELRTRTLPKTQLLGGKEKIYEVDKYGNRERIKRTTRLSSFEKRNAPDGLSSTVMKSRLGGLFSKTYESQFDQRGKEIGREITSHRRLLNERTAKLNEDGSLRETEHKFGRFYSKKTVFRTGQDGREFKEVSRSLFGRGPKQVPVELTAVEKLAQAERVDNKAHLKELQQAAAETSFAEALRDVRSRTSSATKSSGTAYTDDGDVLLDRRFPSPVERELPPLPPLPIVGRSDRTDSYFRRPATPFRGPPLTVPKRDSAVSSVSEFDPRTDKRSKDRIDVAFANGSDPKASAPSRPLQRLNMHGMNDPGPKRLNNAPGPRFHQPREPGTPVQASVWSVRNNDHARPLSGSNSVGAESDVEAAFGKATKQHAVRMAAPSDAGLARLEPRTYQARELGKTVQTRMSDVQSKEHARPSSVSSYSSDDSDAEAAFGRATQKHEANMASRGLDHRPRVRDGIRV
ncbi:hypothetical protein ASD00_32690 [Ensifer sp. Root31]|uniref:hypothetical protein n=1 Tax=Ensifer sp. Root31 TaxID=1736512 RepID=UPI00070B22C9|nr:hypothetical protein [Ensifer sp. Root31]KQU85447.1 hypothetical protein ASD00_32690 [Ensifer sp. Root31]